VANSGGRRRGGGARASARAERAGPPDAAGVRSPAGEGAGGPLSGAQGGGRLSTACRRRLPNCGAVRAGECSWSCREGGGRVGRWESSRERRNARGSSSMAAGGAGGTAVRWGGTARSTRRAKKGHVELELALLPTPTRKRPAGPMHARKPRGVHAGGRVALRPRGTRVDAAHQCCAGGGTKNHWVHRDVADASVRRVALQSARAWHGQSARATCRVRRLWRAALLSFHLPLFEIA
jgi:hypothetical protein